MSETKNSINVNQVDIDDVLKMLKDDKSPLELDISILFNKDTPELFRKHLSKNVKQNCEKERNFYSLMRDHREQMRNYFNAWERKHTLKTFRTPEGALVGFIVISTEKAFNSTMLVINYIYTRINERNKGVGTIMVKNIKDFIDEKKKIMCCVIEDQTMEGFFDKMGFTKQPNGTHYYYSSDIKEMLKQYKKKENIDEDSKENELELKDK